MFGQPERLARMAAALGDCPFRAERDRERRRVAVRLGDVQGELRPLGRALRIAAEPVARRQTRSEHGEILVGLVLSDDLERALEPRQRLGATPRERLDPAEAPQHACSSVRVALRLEERDRLLEQRPGVVGMGCERRHPPGPLQETCALARLARQPRCLLEISSRLGRRREGLGALARPDEHVAGSPLDLGRVLRVRRCLVRGQVVGGDHLHHLVLVCRERRAQVGGRGKVPRAAFAFRQRLVRDMPDEVLEEAVLTVLG